MRTPTLLLAILLPVMAQPPAPQAGHIPVGGFFANLDNLPSPLKESTATWIGQRFDFPMYTNQDIAGACVVAGRTCVWSSYEDHVVLAPSQFYTVRDWAASVPYTNWTDTLNHSKINYSIAGSGGGGHTGLLWLGQFDYFEQAGTGSGNYTAASKGLWTITSGTYADKTVVAYDGSAPFQVTDTVEFGYLFPFAQVNLTFSVFSTRSVAWQYWNGSTWASLTLASDGTSGMTANGQVLFNPPSAWVTKSENGSNTKYWVRAVITGAGTSPTITRAWGDEWVQTPKAWGLAGASYTDVTVNMHHGFANTVITDKLELGFATAPSALYVQKPTGGTGSVVYEYWNGSAWTALSGLSDGTANLNATGFVDWTMPSNWATKSENGTTAYYLRMTVPSNRTITTAWSLAAIRGWSYTDGSRINTGTAVEYNPTPPAASAANFRHQASLTFAIWNANYFTYNPTATAQPGGTVLLMGAWNAALAWAQHLSVGTTAVFWDDLLAGPATTPTSTFPGSGTTDWTGTDYTADLMANQTATRTALRALLPTFYTEANIYPFVDSVTQALNMAWMETFVVNPAAGTRYVDDLGGDTSMSWMDYYKTATNPNNTLGLLVFRDRADGGVLQDAVGGPNAHNLTHFWDLSERGPSYALANYLLGANANTAFEYNTVGSAYVDVGQWLTKSNTYRTTLTNNVTLDLTVGAKTVTVGSTCSLGTCATSVPAVSTFAINVDAQHLWTLGTLQSGCWTGSTNVPVSSQSIASRNANGTIHIVNVNFSSTANVTCVVLAASDHGIEACNTGNNGSLPTIMIGRQAVCTFGVNNGTEVIVPDPIYETVLAGTAVYSITEFYQSVDTLPAGDIIFRYGMSFPSMFMNYGTATGTRNMTWRLGSAVKGGGITCTTTCTDVARRDYSLGSVITRPYSNYYNDPAELETASVPFCVNVSEVYPACTGTWNRMKADGTLGPNINSLSLKAAEGAFLFSANSQPTTLRGGNLRGTAASR